MRKRFLLAVTVVLMSLPTSVGAHAADRCDLSYPPSGLPFGTAECPGVRPGARVSALQDCTLNFLFRGSDGNSYVGTAGHCVLPAGGEVVWPASRAPRALDAEGRGIGVFAYAIDEAPRDFALIRLDEDVEADPEMCFFGGPERIYSEPNTDPFVIHHFGQGAGFGSVPGTDVSPLPARSGMGTDAGGRWRLFVNGVAAPGDSGSPVINDQGKAVGVLIGIGRGDLHVSRLTTHLVRAERLLGIDLKLRTG